ncbi:MAG: 4-hydroxy-tetrahydrodipicolinate reductase [SAR202 cluster bacterium]|nr:4-hydroxy-tetrahydrodipicolinate reductase [SAR202 cluster bacterium]|tara:strand:+ start:145 stop:939 length:795 start_codon:yes stop_codon:yes gene_type:complete
MSRIRVVVHGALGKMGQEVIKAVHKDSDTELTGVVDKYLSKDSENIPNCPITVPSSNNISELLLNTDVIVDFSNSEAASELIKIAPKSKTHLVIGSTGITEEIYQEARKQSEENNTGIVIAPNFAMGAVLMMHLAKIAGKWFEYADLIEMHHEGKIDSPSGTAIAIAESAGQDRKSKFQSPTSEKELIKNARGGVSKTGVSIHSGRMPGRVAFHELVFGHLGQTLTIKHDSINRESFMPGVILAVKAVSKTPGLTIGLEKIMGL